MNNRPLDQEDPRIQKRRTDFSSKKKTVHAVIIDFDVTKDDNDLHFDTLHLPSVQRNKRISTARTGVIEGTE